MAIVYTFESWKTMIKMHKTCFYVGRSVPRSTAKTYTTQSNSHYSRFLEKKSYPWHVFRMKLRRFGWNKSFLFIQIWNSDEKRNFSFAMCCVCGYVTTSVFVKCNLLFFSFCNEVTKQKQTNKQNRITNGKRIIHNGMAKANEQRCMQKVYDSLQYNNSTVTS